MAGDDDDVVVVTIDPNLGQDLGIEGNKKDGDIGPLEDLKGQLETLKGTVQAKDQQVAAARSEADQAQQMAQRALAERDEAVVSAHKTEKESLEAGIAAAKTALDAAEAAYAEAMEKGDFKEAAKHQRTMGTMTARLERLDEAKADLPEKPPVRTERQQQQRPSSDPAEAFAQNLARNGSPQSAAWIRAHPEFATDQRKNAKMLAGHNDAIAEGIAPETPEYFEHIEKFVGLKKGPDRARNENNGQFQRRPAAPAAPVANAGGGMTGETGLEVRLSKGEALSATDGTITWPYDDPTPQKRFKKGDPIGVQEFARRKAIMQQQGQYDKTLSS